jgi:cyanophycinase
MSIHLVGGGQRFAHDTTILSAFVAEAAERAAVGSLPRIGVLLVTEDSGVEYAARVEAELTLAGACEVVSRLRVEGGAFELADLADLDAIYVGGGLTPAYATALEPLVVEIRRLVADGMPYLGYSAGAALAAEQAIVGGWKIGGVAVAPEDTAEDLDEVTVQPGIGLIDIAVDVHAAQWGTLGRLVAATEAGLVSGGVAIDENTALVVSENGLGVVGTGSVWQVTTDDAGVRVSTVAAS